MLARPLKGLFNLDDRVDSVDSVEDRSDAGTATAIALSGATLMPGKTFN